MQHALAEVDAFDDLHVVHRGEPAPDLAGDVAAVKPHAGGEFLCGGVEVVQVVLPLIEVVAHLLVRLADRPAAAAVGEPVLGGGGELGGGVAVAAVHVHHRPGHARVRRHHVRDFLCVRGDAHVLVQRHLLQLGDQSGVVLRGEERRVDPEDLADPQQHRDGQRAHVVLDLVEIARRNLQRLGQRDLAQPTLGAELAQPGTDEGLGHDPRLRRFADSAKGGFASLAIRSCQYPSRLPSPHLQCRFGGRGLKK